ncbi:class III extradiol ring-cleavage dioxygenase [Stutzerimonas frequens]|uniref:DODA-type extradiol aromatic ring-opening family dioxygenase n=1 Tax=Stutzerimonas frequens TaxID=2968969 RepID=UPI002DB653FE|nr:class III extradiol ring-cleavage dioxygenase [Stutzerimonas frequens]WRW25259.1 class III extradiol ring-cleavage dioxygenase [Stutzerimonas frequens]
MLTSATSTAGQTMPTLFVPHGAGPCFFMDWNPPTAWNAMAGFLKGIAATLPARPTAIVLVSGHWLQPSFSVTRAARPTLIYDYHGFPPHTYELRYPAPGEPALAARIAGLLDAAALGGREDAQRGFDHGMFIPLKLMFPDADIPVVQLSLRSDLDPQAHLAAGQALRALRDEGVLIVGSGMSFHNMRGYGDPRFAAISDEFDHWLTAAVELPPGERARALQRWEDAPAARLCHPPRAEEHLIPLLVAAGAAGDSNGRKVFSDRVMHTTLSAYRFG